MPFVNLPNVAFLIGTQRKRTSKRKLNINENKKLLTFVPFQFEALISLSFFFISIKQNSQVQSFDVLKVESKRKKQKFNLLIRF